MRKNSRKQVNTTSPANNKASPKCSSEGERLVQAKAIEEIVDMIFDRYDQLGSGYLNKNQFYYYLKDTFNDESIRFSDQAYKILCD